MVYMVQSKFYVYGLSQILESLKLQILWAESSFMFTTDYGCKLRMLESLKAKNHSQIEKTINNSQKILKGLI